MIPEIWECKFRIKRLIIPETLKADSINMSSPPPPWSEDKAHITGTVRISSLTPLADGEAKGLADKRIWETLAHTQLSDVEVKIFGPVFLNEGEIARSGQPRTGIKNMHLDISTIGILKDSENIGDVWNQLQKLHERGTPELRISNRWFLRSIRSKDHIDKFINAWVTFNMLYGWLTGANSLSKALKGLIGKGIPPKNEREDLITAHKSVLEQLSAMKLWDKRQKIDRGEKLHKVMKSAVQNDQRLEAALLAIGNIRNNLFHGSIKDRSKEASLCMPFVIDLNKRIIKQQIDKL